MTSTERHEARYQRRKAKREAKRIHKTFEEVMSFENIVACGKMCCDGSRWKTSTIHFEFKLLPECRKIYDELMEGKHRFKKFHSFILVEHGKLRHIDALDIRDRTIQKTLCRYLLTEAYSRTFVSCNCASLPDKGMHYCLDKMKNHLRAHYRKHGLEGGIYLFDFKNYFGSLPHAVIKERAKKYIADDRLYALFCRFVDDFQKASVYKPDADQPRGVGLGSEVSQIIALDYASPIDHYIKDALGVKGYGRYMDDGYVISNSLEQLNYIREHITQMAKDMGIEINIKKNLIIPFKHHGFTFLKKRIRLTENGKVVMKIGRKTIKAERRKLNIFRKWVDEGKMRAESVFQAYQSWRSSALRYNAYKTIEAMDTRFAALFAKELRVYNKPFKCFLKIYRTSEGYLYQKRQGW